MIQCDHSEPGSNETKRNEKRREEERREVGWKRNSIIIAIIGCACQFVRSVFLCGISCSSHNVMMMTMMIMRESYLSPPSALKSRGLCLNDDGDNCPTEGTFSLPIAHCPLLVARCSLLILGQVSLVLHTKN